MNHLLSLLESIKMYNEPKEEPPSQGPSQSTKTLVELNLNTLEANWSIFYFNAVKKTANATIPKSILAQTEADKYALLLLTFADHLRQQPIHNPTTENLMNALHSFITNLS